MNTEHVAAHDDVVDKNEADAHEAVIALLALIDCEAKDAEIATNEALDQEALTGTGAQEAEIACDADIA